MSQTKEDIIRKVRGLMEKTTSAGCSEAEAMAASDMVARLMNKYELELTDIKLTEQANCQEVSAGSSFSKNVPTHFVVNGIAYLTDTKGWLSVRNGVNHVIFFGFETDVVVAKYIYDICDRAMIHSWMHYKIQSDYKEATASRRREIQHGFEVGMANRINQRLRAMKDAIKRENSSTGRDLVIVKSAIVAAELDKLGFAFGKARTSRGKAMSGAAYSAGVAAGDKVSFNKGVGSTKQGRVE